MKVGILGSGPVGQALGHAFSAEGHQVTVGTRNVSKPELLKWQKANPEARLGSFAEAAAFGEVVVLAAEGKIAEQVLKLAGAAALKNKVVIDATNPIEKAPPTNGVLHFFTTLEDSLMERLQKAFPEAKFVKCFSCVGNGAMYKPSFPGGKPSMFICGNDEGAKKTVKGILEQFGWEWEDMGKVEAARAIEPLCILWCIPGLTRNEWNHAFKLLRG